jgi:hypothetical protein
MAKKSELWSGIGLGAMWFGVLFGIGCCSYMADTGAGKRALAEAQAVKIIKAGDAK